MQKNNISYLLADVRRPTKKKRLETHNIPAVREPRTSARRFAVIIGVFLLSLGSITAWEVKDNAVGTVLTAYRSFISAAESAKQYDTDAMGRSLKKADASLKSMNIYARILGIIPAFKEMPTFVGALQEFSKTAFFVTKTTDTLKKEGISLMWNDGGRLISELEEIRARVRTMTGSLAKVRNGMASFGLATDMSTDYLTLYSKMTETADILDGAINLLKGESNLVVFFMNDSEMRATGGFIGSYATVKLSGGEVKDIAVNDIYYPDKFLEEKVIPPTPLMGITTDWEARDANWFLDFPTSVSKVLGFLEKSPVYADGGTKFDGAVAINHKVVTDILKITGPIELPDYGIVLDNSNFLEEVQKEVSRDSTIRGGERKNILKSLLPELISRVQKLSSSDKEELARVLEGRLNNKDVQAYFVDKRLQNFVSKSLWAGEVYQPADSEYGDYLAVSVSNIGGEKTDAYIRQKVSLRSVISISGTVSDTLSVTRIHEGDKASEAFYKARNQAYIKVLTPQGANLTETAGETTKTVRPAVNYASKGYETDKDVALYESGVESGKAVFGRWLAVPAGSDKELTMEYEHIGTLSNRFRFVYEKQSGVDSMFSYSVQTPPGYVFKETGTSTYEYESANLPTRLIIDLTLSRL